MDVKSLKGSEISEGHNLIVVGKWNKKIKTELLRFGQIVEAVREIAKSNITSDVSNQQLKNMVGLNVSKVKTLLHDRWEFLNRIKMENQPILDEEIIHTIASIADSTSVVTEYYKKTIYLLGSILTYDFSPLRSTQDLYT